MRVFGIDPGSTRTGYGCIETDGRRHRLLICGALTLPPGATLAARLQVIHSGLGRLVRDMRADCVAVESLFYARNVRSALVLGHARGVALLAAVEEGVPVAEYSPAEIKQAVVGYGRADKSQIQQMVKLLLGLSRVPFPHDAADALAVALCHAHTGPLAAWGASRPGSRRERSWRAVRTLALSRRSAP